MTLPDELMRLAGLGELTLFLAPGVEVPDRWRALSHQAPLPERAELRSWLRRGGALFVGYRADEPAFAQRFAALTEVWGGRLPKAWVASAPGRIPDVVWQKWVWKGLWLFTASADEVLEALEAT